MVVVYSVWVKDSVCSNSFTFLASRFSSIIGSSSVLITVSHVSSGLSQELKTHVKHSKLSLSGYVFNSEYGMSKQIPNRRHFWLPTWLRNK